MATATAVLATSAATMMMWQTLGYKNLLVRLRARCGQWNACTNEKTRQLLYRRPRRRRLLYRRWRYFIAVVYEFRSSISTFRYIITEIVELPPRQQYRQQCWWWIRRWWRHILTIVYESRSSVSEVLCYNVTALIASCSCYIVTRDYELWSGIPKVPWFINTWTFVFCSITVRQQCGQLWRQR